MIGRLFLLGLAILAAYVGATMEVRVTADIAIRAILIGLALFFIVISLLPRR